MRTTRIEMIETKITTHSCDFCNYSTEDNRGCCGTAQIMECDFCSKDCCHEHRDFFSEDTLEDYPIGVYACPDCVKKASEAWDLTIVLAGRYDDIVEFVHNVFDNIENYRAPVLPVLKDSAWGDCD